MQKCIECKMWGRRLNYETLLWISNLANSFGIKGITFFKNDGSIKITAEGEERNLLFFIKKLKRGNSFIPFFSRIENFSVIWNESKNEFENFSISES